MQPQSHPKNSQMNNNAFPAASTGLAAKRIGVVVAVALFLLSGCEHLAPLGGKKPPIPPELVVKDRKPKEEPAPDNVPGENIGTNKVEVYPPSGALFGASEATPEKSAKQPFHAKEGKYTLNFDDADLAEVAKVILGDTLKANYVISPKVTGKVSLQTTRALAEDEMVPTLELLLKTNGAVLIHERGLYRIEPEANATVNAPSTRLGLAGGSVPPGYQLRVVPLRYVGVAEMQKVIEPLMPPKSVVRADESRNLLLLAGTPDELESVLETIRIFDVDFMRGMSVGLFPLKNVEAGTVAEELDKLLTVSGKGPLTGMFRILPIERLQAILVVTPQPRYLDEVRSWIERLDRYNTAKTGNMHVYRVQNVDALDLANTLGNIFGQGQNRSQTPGASLAPGMTGASIGGGGASSGLSGGAGGASSGFGGSSSSGLGGSTSSGLGGASSSGLGGSTSSGLGGSTSSGSGGSSASGLGGGSSSSGFGGSSSSGSGGSSGGGASGQARSRGMAAVDLGNNMKIVADPANNALVVMAKPQEYRDIEAVIKQLDVMPLQVLIDATIVEITLTGSLQYGLQWLFSHGESATAMTSVSTANQVIDAAAAAAAASGGGFAYALAGNNIKVLVTALAADNKVNVISSPSLMVLNNQEANINVGNKVPVTIGGGIVSTGGTVQAPGVQYMESGVTLKVRPRVNAGGLVIMDIVQEISTPSSTTVNGQTATQFAQRKIQSQVAVTDGDTLALGGLINDSRTNGVTGIPYLGQIPWLGLLFSATDKEVQRTELVVLLTPRVVAKKQDVTAVTNEFRRKLTGLYGPSANTPPATTDQGAVTFPN